MFAGEDTLISSGSSREPSALLLQATGKDHGAGIECCGGGWEYGGRGGEGLSLARVMVSVVVVAMLVG